MTDSASSCPLFVSLYSTLGGISLYLCLSNIPPFANSLSLLDNVLVLKPFIDCLNCLCLTGFVLQHNGISISSVPLFVINFLNFAVSFISLSASYPLKAQTSCCGGCIMGNNGPFFNVLLVSIIALTLPVYP